MNCYSLEDIITSAELSIRTPSHIGWSTVEPFLETIGAAINAGYQETIDSLTRASLELCRAGTACLSVLRQVEGESKFYWDSLAGALAPYIGGTTPRNFSPCGVTLDRRAPQLFWRPGRYFNYLQDLKPEIMEVLVIPMDIGGAPFATLWIVGHDDVCRFDQTHVRVMNSLASFTSAAIATLPELSRAVKTVPAA